MWMRHGNPSLPRIETWKLNKWCIGSFVFFRCWVLLLQILLHDSLSRLSTKALASVSIFLHLWHKALEIFISSCLSTRILWDELLNWELESLASSHLIINLALNVLTEFVLHSITFGLLLAVEVTRCDSVSKAHWLTTIRSGLLRLYLLFNGTLKLGSVRTRSWGESGHILRLFIELLLLI